MTPTDPKTNICVYNTNTCGRGQNEENDSQINFIVRLHYISGFHNL